MATCPAATATEDHRAKGGGFEMSTTDEVPILAIRQTRDGLGWRVTAVNTTGIAQAMFTFAQRVGYRTERRVNCAGG